MLSKLWHGKLTLSLRIQESRPALSGQWLRIDFLLQSHECLEQSFRPRRATGNMHIHRNIAVDPLQHVIPLLERPSGDCASPHRNHILRLRHLVVEPNHLGRHLFGHRPRDDHQVSLPRRRPEDLCPEARHIVPRHGGRNHLNCAACQPELHRPNRAPPSPVVEFLDGGNEDSLLAEFDLQPFFNHGRFAPLQ